MQQLFNYFQGLVDPWRVTCPRHCLCELRNSSHLGAELKTVDCSNRNLKKIPSEIPAGVEALHLQVSFRSDMNTFHRK